MQGYQVSGWVYTVLGFLGDHGIGLGILDIVEANYATLLGYPLTQCEAERYKTEWMVLGGEGGQST